MLVKLVEIIGLSTSLTSTILLDLIVLLFQWDLLRKMVPMQDFDIDLATAVFEKYGITVNWQPIDWDLKEAELTKGTIDLIWNGYSATDDAVKR